MKLWLDKDDTVEQFLDDLVLVCLVLLSDLRTLDFCLLVNGSLDCLDASSVLFEIATIRQRTGESHR